MSDSLTGADASEWLTLPCISVEQPLAIFFVSVIDAPDLVAISHADVRRLQNEGRDFEDYLGFQRPLREPRVKELRRYVNYVDATFPTSILLAIDRKDVEYDETDNTLRVRKADDVATVIDGQHRIAGLEAAEHAFQSIVTVFVDLDLEDKAHVFSTINLKQTKVNPSLARDLFELAKARSPQKTAHTITRLLNSGDGSPLYRRIKMLGMATEGRENETVTQALVVDEIIDMLSWDPAGDRDRIKRKEPLDPGSLQQQRRRPLRHYFISEQDAVIAKNIWNLFDAARQAWPEAWELIRPGHMLNRTTGVFVLLRFLREYYAATGVGRDVIATDELVGLFATLGLENDDFTSERFPSGGQGRSELWKLMSPLVPSSSG